MSGSPSIEDLLAVAVEAAEVGGRSALSYFGKPIAVERKLDDSPVTAADHASEAAMRAVLARHFPGHGVLGEEAGETRGDGVHRWILDPIDGTRTFVRGVPLWGVQVALEVEGEPVVGVIRLAALDETVAAARGLGCLRNGTPCRVSTTPSLADSLVVCTDERLARSFAPGWDRLAAASGMVRTWADCYGYALVATGRAEVCLDPLMSIWDTAPLLVILEEAGGLFTDWSGRRTHVSSQVIASNGHLHKEALAELSGNGPG